jgi:F-type H+-transporting ATPase subunit delta
LTGQGGGNDNGRVDVSEPASISTGIASRYAQAVFDLARDEDMLPALEADIVSLEAALQDSGDLRALISSPIYSRDEQGNAILAIAQAMGLTPVMRNVLGLMAQKRRLFVLPNLLQTLRTRLADARGEVGAEVTSAQPLTPEQAQRLADTLSAQAGKAVRLQTRVDPSLIGGLVVRLGSRMIDTSIRAKLGQLQNMMKEVG